MWFRTGLFMLLLTSGAQAQELPEVPDFKLEPLPAGSDRILSLPKGEPAPYSGQLFDASTALRWANYLEQYRVQLGLRERAHLHLRAAERGYWEAVVVAERTAGKTVQEDLGTRLHKVEDDNARLQQELLQPTPWYSTREFGFVAGVVLSLSGAIVWQSAF